MCRMNELFSVLPNRGPSSSPVVIATRIALQHNLTQFEPTLCPQPRCAVSIWRDYTTTCDHGVVLASSGLLRKVEIRGARARHMRRGQLRSPGRFHEYCETDLADILRVATSL